jgi:hypothetical protein
LKINPNGRIPALEDRSTTPATPLFESGAILLYLADNYDKEEKVSYSREKHPKEYYEQLCWLFFQNAGVGPMQGQANRTASHDLTQISSAMHPKRFNTASIVIKMKRVDCTVFSILVLRRMVAISWAITSPLVSLLLRLTISGYFKLRMG